MSINEEAAKHLVARLQQEPRSPGSDNDITIRSIERMIELEKENRSLRMTVERYEAKKTQGRGERTSIF